MWDKLKSIGVIYETRVFLIMRINKQFIITVVSVDAQMLLQLIASLFLSQVINFCLFSITFLPCSVFPPLYLTALSPSLSLAFMSYKAQQLCRILCSIYSTRGKCTVQTRSIKFLELAHSANFIRQVYGTQKYKQLNTYLQFKALSNYSSWS